MTGPADELPGAAELLGPLADASAARALAQSVVDAARTIFHAQAASISELLPASRELEFVAVAGEGETSLPGTRFSADQGIAGWVLRARQSVTVKDVRSDPRFALDVAERSGYVPEGLMAVPLLGDDDVPLGVLQVLDRPERPSFALGETQLLGLLAEQAIVAIRLRQVVRRLEVAGPAGGPADGGGAPHDDALAAVAALRAATQALTDPDARAEVGRAAAALAALAGRAGRPDR